MTEEEKFLLLDKYRKVLVTIREAALEQPPKYKGLYRLMLKANRWARELGAPAPYSKIALKGARKHGGNIFRPV